MKSLLNITLNIIFFELHMKSKYLVFQFINKMQHFTIYR